MDRRRVSVAETGRWHFTNKPVDMTGQRYGRLVCVRRSVSDGAGRARWLCRCDCGGERIVYRQLLISGDTKSCGCLRAELARANGLRSRGKRREELRPHRPPRLRMLDQLTATWGAR